ncbi:MAG: hypothetical protein LBQ88_05360 [Treponema sp.]|jgi:hypothetical protein|nr:hypothetical protein [Treponema sp.]
METDIKLHQIIYTSCKRGIDGFNDGQQVFSYDKGFKYSKSDNVRSLFTYQPPSLQPGVVMTEEIAKTMPQAFTFRKIDSGTYAITLNTYIGRDYMPTGGRFGNYLSHSIIFNAAYLQNYPCEFFESEMLRGFMDKDEVNNPDPPGFLPVPVLSKGSKISVNSVIEFLNNEGRMDIYKNMFYALLSFNTEKKRVVICDKIENIIFWIAALEFTLPLKNVCNINFTTYEYNPSLSNSQICGVVPDGTSYSRVNPEQHFVFDIINGKTTEFNLKNDFIDFLDLSMSMSYDIMQAFHQFLGEGYSYTEAGLEYFDAYSLYVLRSDGIEGIGHEIFKKASAFAEKYSKKDMLLSFTRELLKQMRVIINLPLAYFRDVLSLILKQYRNFSDEERTGIRDCITGRILNIFSNPNFNIHDFGDSFRVFYSLCIQYGYNLIPEFVKDSNRDQLKSVLQYDDVSIEKIKIIIYHIFLYVKENSVESAIFKPDSNSGILIRTILESTFTSHPEMSGDIIRHIINTFGVKCVYLLSMMFNINSLLINHPNDCLNIETLWSHYYKTASRYRNEERTAVINYLLSNKIYGHVYYLFNIILNAESNIEKYKEVFEDHLERIVMKYEPYRIGYAGKILSSYYNKLSKSYTEAAEQAKRGLLNLILKYKLHADFIDELSEHITENIALAKPSDEELAILKDIINYIFSNKQKLGKRVKLFAAGIIVEKYLSQGFNRGKNILNDYSGGEQYNLEGIREEEQIRYIEWIEPVISEFCTKAEDLKDIYALFNMTEKSRRKFLDNCMQYKLKQSGEKNNFRPLCEYLIFIFSIDDDDIFRETGKNLSGLNKSKMELLDKEMLTRFEKEKNVIDNWEKIRKIALSTNPLLNSISRILST